jgi:hypothetical protein
MESTGSVCPEKSNIFIGATLRLAGWAARILTTPTASLQGTMTCMGRQILRILQNLERNEPSQSNVHAHDALKGAISADDPRASVQASELSF